MANEYNVLSDAITIFTILSRNATFVSNEFKKLTPHPDGDLHTMSNARNAHGLQIWLRHYLPNPVYSHMARVERICPAMGLTPIPACDVMDIGDIHDEKSFDQCFAPTQWLYAKGSDQIHEWCIQKRTDFPLESVRMPSMRKEIPQVAYEVTYMTFPSATKGQETYPEGRIIYNFEK